MKKQIIILTSLLFIVTVAYAASGRTLLSDLGLTSGVDIDVSTLTTNPSVDDIINTPLVGGSGGMEISAADLNAKFNALNYKINNLNIISSCSDLSTTKDIFGNTTTTQESACVVNGCEESAGSCIEIQIVQSNFDPINIRLGWTQNAKSLDQNFPSPSTYTGSVINTSSPNVANLSSNIPVTDAQNKDIDGNILFTATALIGVYYEVSSNRCKLLFSLDNGNTQNLSIGKFDPLGFIDNETECLDVVEYIMNRNDLSFNIEQSFGSTIFKPILIPSL